MADRDRSLKARPTRDNGLELPAPMATDAPYADAGAHHSTSVVHRERAVVDAGCEDSAS